MIAITYRAVEAEYEGRRYWTDNGAEVRAFLGPVAECLICNGYGEYETDLGPRGCMPCLVLMAYQRHDGSRGYVELGDTIVKLDDQTLINITRDAR